MSAMTPLMRYHGGKCRLADWVISHFPPHGVYVEPFGGAAGVLFRKDPAPAEIYNDLDQEIVNVFRVLRNSESAERLRELCELTPYARDEFELAQELSDDGVESARRTLFRAWASFGSAGATRGRSGMRTYSRPDGKHLGVARSWVRLSSILPRFQARLSHVVIENRPAIDVMQQHDSVETLHYVDPPYLPETRSFAGGRYYRHEMSADDHEALLKVLCALEGFVVLSGYPSSLYGNSLLGWHQASRATCGSSRWGSVPRQECLWLNPRAAEFVSQLSLNFEEVRHG